eukprot:c12921_g2_i2.p1 GENE.c12921_g2_i2~~c12921_g2_i2.p1  ORF type:complete len:285 (-),score=94.52 c12921_g2_i2:152-901(-)
MASPVLLHEFALCASEIFRIPYSNLQVCVLQSPCVVEYNMNEISLHEATTHVLSPCVAFLIKHNHHHQQQQPQQKHQAQTSEFERHHTITNQHKQLMRCDALSQHMKKSKQAELSFQNHVREQMSALLSDSTKRICLATLSNMTCLSKSALSMWRRHKYHGNGQAIAFAVTQAISSLAQCEFVYMPCIHDGSCKPSNTKWCCTNTNTSKKHSPQLQGPQLQRSAQTGADDEQVRRDTANTIRGQHQLQQ